MTINAAESSTMWEAHITDLRFRGIAFEDFPRLRFVDGIAVDDAELEYEVRGLVSGCCPSPQPGSAMARLVRFPPDPPAVSATGGPVCASFTDGVLEVRIPEPRGADDWVQANRHDVSAVAST